MKPLWIEQDDDIETLKFGQKFWSNHAERIREDRFWSDVIREVRDQPQNRLTIAVENLPLPAAFSEALIAIRAELRIRKATGQSVDTDVSLLYRFGAVKSMMVPYSAKLKEPGYNIMEIIPGKRLFDLPIPYEEIGYRKIDAFTKTDCRMFVQFWGEPKGHQTMNEYYHEIWVQYEDVLWQKRRTRAFFP